jgi:hypothetical protein
MLAEVVSSLPWKRHLQATLHHDIYLTAEVHFLSPCLHYLWRPASLLGPSLRFPCQFSAIGKPPVSKQTSADSTASIAAVVLDLVASSFFLAASTGFFPYPNGSALIVLPSGLQRDARVGRLEAMAKLSDHHAYWCEEFAAA